MNSSAASSGSNGTISPTTRSWRLLPIWGLSYGSGGTPTELVAARSGGAWSTSIKSRPLPNNCKLSHATLGRSINRRRNPPPGGFGCHLVINTLSPSAKRRPEVRKKSEVRSRRNQPVNAKGVLTIRLAPGCHLRVADGRRWPARPAGWRNKYHGVEGCSNRGWHAQERRLVGVQ